MPPVIYCVPFQLDFGIGNSLNDHRADLRIKLFMDLKSSVNSSKNDSSYKNRNFEIFCKESKWTKLVRMCEQTLALRSTLKHGEMDGVVALQWFPKSPLLVS